MKVGIDARMFGPHVGGGGLGRYVEQLVIHLQSLEDQNRYVLFLKPENFDACKVSNDRFLKRNVDIHWYTLKEQLQLAKRIDRENLDLVHFPHWNVPWNIRTPFVVTIHDLILLEQPRSAKVSTRNLLVFAIKYLGFKFTITRTIQRSRHIIAVSEYTKQSILTFFPNTDPNKISVVHEGVTILGNESSEKLQMQGAGKAARSRTETYGDKPQGPRNEAAEGISELSPYFLYVGNAYPHKNLEALLHAFSFFHKLHPEVTLVLAGRNDVFYKNLQKELDEIDVPNENVRFIMNPSDSELHDLYQNATLYLFPSRIEGFGLPALEAMQEGVPVAAAKAGSLPEILGDAAVYFHPDDIEEMVAVMERTLSDQSLRTSLAQKGKEQVKRYSWKTMAISILSIYNKILPTK